MASVYKRTWKDDAGKAREAAGWTADVKIGDGWRRLPGFRDRKATEELARKVERLSALKVAGEQPDAELYRWLEGLPSAIKGRLARFGLLTGRAASATRKLADHLRDYRQALLDGGATKQHAELTHNRIMAVLDGTGAALWADITASGVSRYLADRRQPKRKGDGADAPIVPGLSAASCNHHLRAVKSFCAWMIRERRASDNPLSHLSKLNEDVDRRHVRRALEADELRKLLDATGNGPTADDKATGGVVRYGMTGAARAMLYRLAVETGLRASELRSLTRGSFDLDADPPTVTVAAAYSKRRRDDVLPMRADTADAVRAFLAEKLPTAAAFKLPSKSNIVRMLRLDMADAGIPEVDDAGRVFDFHGLRHTFISNLAAGGIHPKEAQQLARHSTITLTMDRYTHVARNRLSAALDALPDLSARPPQAARATGTDGRCAAAKKHPNSAGVCTGGRTGGNGVPGGSPACATKRASVNRLSPEKHPLSSRKTGHSCASGCTEANWAEPELNRRHTDFQSVALPTELPALEPVRGAYPACGF